MSTLEVVIQNRDFTDRLVPAGVHLQPVRYSWNAVGGPEMCEVEAIGNEVQLWELLNLLRCPLEVWDWRGTAVWWGYIESVELRIGAITAGVTLDSMSNHVTVMYSNSLGSGDTDPVSDADSIAEYGTKELRYSASDTDDVAAQTLRDLLLAQRKYPVPTVQIGEGAELAATLYGRGWWHSLEWRYWASSSGQHQYVTNLTGDWAMGDAAGRQKVAQGITIPPGDDWKIRSVQAYLKKVGSPADNVTLEVCADSSGSPGSVLATVSVAASTLSTSMGWITFSLASSLAITPGTAYWLVLRRSGAVDASNYYRWGVDPAAGYSGGSGKSFDGAIWTAIAPASDAGFKLAGSAESTQQIQDVADDLGEFLTSTRIETASSVDVDPYREGTNTALQEITSLLGYGTSSGTRLLATVGRDRELRVYTEPTAAEATDLFLDAEGRLFASLDGPVLLHTCPVAQWARLHNVIPDAVTLGLLANPSPVFLERSEYTVASQRLTIEPKTIESPWAFAKVSQG